MKRRQRTIVPRPSEAFIATHAHAAYVVLDTTTGRRVDTYEYDPDVFDSRRAAWQLALADAAVRNEARKMGVA